MAQAGWRKWHRWIGFAAFPFVLFAATTGIIAGIAEMTSEDEEAREAARDRISEVKLSAPQSSFGEPVAKAIQNASRRGDDAPVDKVLIDFKADPPTVTIYLGKPTGGEDKKLLYDARSGEFLREESYADKPFLTRLHSGEALGDWGLVFGTGWGVALLAILLTGIVIYFQMRKPGKKGLGRLFW